MPSLPGNALALQAERAPAIGAGGIDELDRAVERRHAHFAAEHGFIERDRQIEPQIRCRRARTTDARDD